MPVRIIFRGLMLFQIPDSGRDANKLVAFPINKPTSPPAGARPQGHAHNHNHRTEIQILTGAEKGTDLLGKSITDRATLDIIVPGTKGVVPSPSFRNHIPDSAVIIDNATDAIKAAGRGDPNTTIMQNRITVDRGIVRARNVTTWDQGGHPYPLRGKRDEIGAQADLLAVLKFMGSRIEGHVATDVVVEIVDVDSVDLQCDHDNRYRGGRKGSDNPSDPHTPPGTVEILVTNFEPVTAKPIPWGLDFQWLFEAAGYNEADLAGSEFDEWVDAGRAYDSVLFDEERTMFFGADGTKGRPFPYLRSAADLTPLQPLTRPLNVYACKGLAAPATPPITFP